MFVPAAPAAVTSIVVSPSGVNLIHGQSQQFAAIVTVTQNSSTAVFWTYSPTIGDLNANTGLYKAPNSVFSTQVITITATSQADPTKKATATVTLDPTVSVTAISPSNPTLGPGEQQQFTATVQGTTNTNVTWAISPQIGDLTPAGLYTAPASIATRQTVTLTAISVADPTQSRSTTITLQPSNAVTVTISPTAVTLSNSQTQQFTATLENASIPGVRWSISPTTGQGTISDTGLYTAPALIASAQTVKVTATALADGSKSASATVTLGALLNPGTGAPSSAIAQLFFGAYYRFKLHQLAPEPAGPVRRLGTTGLVQEFNAAQTGGGRYALILPNLNNTVQIGEDKEDTPVVLGMTPELYTYFNSVGVGTAGYPTMDATLCPAFDAANACSWALFDRNYALFAYKVALFTGQNFTIRNNFYTRWFALGGINGLGRPVDGEVAVTASTTSTATVQTYSNGAIYQYTNGPNNGKYYAVAVPIYGLYVTNGGPGGRLGFPTSDELTLASGVHRQTFQGGALEYTPGSGVDPTLRLPVVGVALTSTGTITGSVNMKLGDAITVTAKPVADSGVELTGRAVSWATTNSRVVAVQASNDVAVLKAVGGGTASVSASSEGVVSQRINIVVTAPCCQVGEGAPTVVQQAFQDALSRTRLSVVLPAQAAASRAGAGYVQSLQSSDPANPAVYLLAKSDRIGTAYLVTGELLKKYQELGGPAGSLGYPTSDATAGGRQVFENAALAGTPPRPVIGVLLTKWALLGYETGAAGNPVADPVPFSTFGANSGSAQAFTGGVIYAASAGPRSGQAYFASGLILARYIALGGPGGVFGMPVSDEFMTGGKHIQDFEGGSIEYSPGDTEAREQAAEKSPAVLASPSSVVAGGRVRLAVVGFPARSPIRVSITGQADFLINNEAGAYAWEIFVPLATTTRTLEVRAADTRSSASASATISVKGLAENRVQLVKVSGDSQTGVPGGLLARPLKVVLKDAGGSVVIGAPVTFEPSPGAKVSATSVLTDQNGEAEVWLRLPPLEGISLVKADAPSIALSPATFGARAAALSLGNFPKLLAAGDAAIGNGSATLSQKGALLAAVASMLRYHQNSGELPGPNGPADPASLNQFLKRFCAAAATGAPVCDGFVSNPDGGDQVVNLWRVAEFVGGGIDPTVAKADLSTVSDWLSQGSPVLLSLALTANGAPAGGHFVVATGITAEGGVLIHDPVSASRTNLGDLLNGFDSGGVQWKAELRGILRFALRTPAAGRFLLAAVGQRPETLAALAIDLQSAAGACGVPLDLPDAANLLAPGGASTRVSRFVACDGADAAYQLTVGAAQPFRATLTDLAAGGTASELSGSAVAAYQVVRRNGALSVAPLQLSFDAGSVVNAATFQPGLAPGSLMAIFGTGLAGSKGNTTVELGGSAARVVYASPFQINAEVPLALAPGMHTLSVRSDLGSMSQSVEIRDVAPAIFLLGSGRPAVVNQSGSLNGPTAPLTRGQVLIAYATGLGTVRASGQLSVTNSTVTAILNGTDLPASFAGLAPGFIGLYQVNIPIPAATLPGLDLPFALKVGNATSDSVSVSVQ